MRLTMSQALVRYLAHQYIDDDGDIKPYFAGVWAIFGHGNVAAIGEALYANRDILPTWRAHNEQGMAMAAIAYAKAHMRRRAMACTTSIGPGATNLVTAAALAHANRLPVLFLPGDVFANRRPDPVLQQIEDFGDGTVSANDCFRPVSRYFDRITRPEQIITALPRAMATFMDAARCGPVTLALCQDVQAEACEYPDAFFEKRVWTVQAPEANGSDVHDLAQQVRAAKRPLLIAGGGVLYSKASDALTSFAEDVGVPCAETQAGKGALHWRNPLNLGAIGVTGSAAANATAAEADLVIGVGTRLQDFTTASRSLFSNPDRTLVQVNVGTLDLHKHGATPIFADAKRLLSSLRSALDGYAVDDAWRSLSIRRANEWRAAVHNVLSEPGAPPFAYAQILGAIDRTADENSVVVCAAGTLPGELHKFWRAAKPGGYHVEYAYSCMGYEIAGGLGVKMARPDREVFVVAGDGSYMMMNSELATAVMMGHKIIVVVFDNHGYGCIDNLQRSAGSPSFNNMFEDTVHEALPAIDFVAHAKSMGAEAVRADSMDALESALRAARLSDASSVITVPTVRDGNGALGGAWWDVAVPAVSSLESVNAARAAYEAAIGNQRVDG